MRPESTLSSSETLPGAGKKTPPDCRLFPTRKIPHKTAARFSYFDPVAPAPEPVVVAGFVELVLVAGALVWFDALV